MPRDDFQFEELIGEALLVGERLVVDREQLTEVGALAGQGDFFDVERHASDTGQGRDGLVEVCLRPLAGLGQLVDYVGNDVRVGFGEIAIGKIEAPGIDDAFGGDQDAGIRILLGDREVGVPDGPGIDLAGRKTEDAYLSRMLLNGRNRPSGKGSGLGNYTRIGFGT